MIPEPRHSRLSRAYEDLRYENGAWPLYRWDQNLRYLTKSLRHRTTPWSLACQVHALRMRTYIENGTWRRPAMADGSAVRVLFGGDLMWVRRNFDKALSRELCTQIAKADLAIVNLETPIDEQRPVPTYAYETLHYNADAGFLRPWQSRQPRIVSLCNNHALDQGLAGLRRTRGCALTHGLNVLGGCDGGQEGVRVETKGMRVAAVGVTYGINGAGPSGSGLAAYPDGIPVIRFGDPASPPDFARLAAILARLGPADVRILVAHWGFEYEYFPAELQREHARSLIQLGFDIIVGSSPHVLQPIDVVSIDGADSACPTQVVRGGSPRFGLIAWSLGNLCTIMPTLACRVAALLEVELVIGPGGGLGFSHLRCTPTVSARGLGGDWLAGATMSLDEVDAHAARGIACRAAKWPCRAHAESILGSLARASALR